MSSPTDTRPCDTWHSRRAQQHVWIPAFGLINRGSQGSTGMVGERSAQADDAVTGERPLAALATRCSSILGGGCQLPPSRQCATRPADSAQRSPRHGIGRTPVRPLPAGGTALTHLEEGVLTPTAGALCVGAASPRQARAGLYYAK
jgi:hypothetical protein